MSVAPILTRALSWGGIAAVVIAIVGGGVGLLVAGTPGLVGGLLGAVTSAVFLGLTAASILIAARVTKNEPGSVLFFGIVLGAWFFKLVIFVLLAIWLRSQTFIDPMVFFLTIVASVLASLIADVLAFQRARVPYVSDLGDRDPTT